MKIFKIFLASSFELKSDRDQFEIFINRKNKEWVGKGIFLELVIWEDALDCMEQTRLQDKYNVALKECDIFVLLFSTKVGEYTREEFELAYQCFLTTKKPIIFVYFKNIAIAVDKIKREDQKTLWSFQDRLVELQHLQTYYETANDLILFFNKQLDKLVASGFFDDSRTNESSQIHQHTASSKHIVPHFLTLPPFKPELFLGRENDLLALKDKFFHQNINLLFITGEGGLGKTTLAAEYFHSNQQKYKHIAWVLSGKSIQESLLSSLSQSLGLQYDARSSPKDRLEKLLLTMSSLPKPCFLVIDDADNSEDLEETYLALRRCSNFHVLLTTRITKFHSVVTYPVEILPEEKSIELFRKYYPFHHPHEDGLFFQIREAVGGNTLVIEMLAKNLAILNRNENTYSLANLIEDIQKKGLLGTAESGSLETTYHAQNKMTLSKPSDIITAMYDLSNLTPEETSLLSVFAILPTEKLEYKEITLYFDPLIDPGKTLLSLSQKGWIEFHEESRTYKCSPLIQEIVRRKSRKLTEDCQHLVKTLSEQLEFDYKTGNPLHFTLQDASRIIRYGESVLRNLPIKNYQGLVLVENIGMYHNVTGNLLKANQNFTFLNQLAKEFLRESPGNKDYCLSLAVSYKRMGDVSRSLGDFSHALTCFEQYHEVAKNLNETYPDNETYQFELTVSLDRLGLIARIQNEWNQSLDYFTESYLLCKKYLQQNNNNQKLVASLAIASQNLGNLYITIGNIDKALEYSLEFNSLEKEMLDAYPNDFGYQYAYGISHGAIGNCYYNQGNLDKALEHFDLYYQIFDKLYHEYPLNVGLKNELAVCSQFLGLIYKSKKDYKKALEYIIPCYQLEKELYQDFPLDVRIKNGCSIASSWLGEINYDLKNYPQAISYYAEFYQLAKELHNDHPHNLEYERNYGISLLYMAEAKIIQKDFEQALSYYQQSNEICTKLVEKNPKDIDNRNILAITNQKLGLFYREHLINPELSLDYIKRGIKILKELIEEAPGYDNYQKNLADLESLLT